MNAMKNLGDRKCKEWGLLILLNGTWKPPNMDLKCVCWTVTAGQSLLTPSKGDVSWVGSAEAGRQTGNKVTETKVHTAV